jgi:hypothetical protein
MRSPWALERESSEHERRNPSVPRLSKRENSIPVVDDEAVWMIEHQELVEMLSGPLCGRVLSEVAVQDPA